MLRFGRMRRMKSGNVRQLSVFSEWKKKVQEELKNNSEIQESWSELTKEKEKIVQQQQKQAEKIEKMAKKTIDKMSPSEEKINQHKKHVQDIYEQQRKASQSNEFFTATAKYYEETMGKIRQTRNRFVDGETISKVRKNWSEAIGEVFKSTSDGDLDSTLSSIKPGVGVPSKKDTGEANKKDKKNDEEQETKTYDGPDAMVLVKEEETAWDRIGAKLRETPIIQGVMNAARQAAETRAGKKVGEGAKYAKDRIGDASEDAREYWETSQNPWVYRLSSLYDGLFGDTEMAIALREIRRAEPTFILEDWKENVANYAIPEILSAFLRGDSMKLKPHFGEAAYNTVNYAIRDRKKEGLVVDPTILDIQNVEVLAAQAEDKHAPIIVLQLMAQQINCIKNREGEIVEGAEDEIRAVYYVLAFQRNYDEETGSLRWKIVEMAMVGGVPYY